MPSRLWAWKCVLVCPKNQETNVTTEAHPATGSTGGAPLATTNQNLAITGIQLASEQPAITDETPTFTGRDGASTDETTL